MELLSDIKAECEAFFKGAMVKIQSIHKTTK